MVLSRSTARGGSGEEGSGAQRRRFYYINSEIMIHVFSNISFIKNNEVKNNIIEKHVYVLFVVHVHLLS